MTLPAAPILNHGPTVYTGWTKPAAPTPQWEELAGDKRRIADEILSPILNSDDITPAFQAKWPAFQQWRNAVADALVADTPQDLDAVLRQEDVAEEKLLGAFNQASDKLGQAIKPVLGGMQLRKIIRKSVLPHLESWPENSYGIIAKRLTQNELCLACVLHYLATGAGQKTNVSTLSIWGFIYAQKAYFEAGVGAGDLGLWHKLERDE